MKKMLISLVAFAVTLGAGAVHGQFYGAAHGQYGYGFGASGAACGSKVAKNMQKELRDLAKGKKEFEDAIKALEKAQAKVETQRKRKALFHSKMKEHFKNVKVVDQIRNHLENPVDSALYDRPCYSYPYLDPDEATAAEKASPDETACHIRGVKDGGTRDPPYYCDTGSNREDASQCHTEAANELRPVNNAFCKTEERDATGSSSSPARDKDDKPIGLRSDCLAGEDGNLWAKHLTGDELDLGICSELDLLKKGKGGKVCEIALEKYKKAHKLLETGEVALKKLNEELEILQLHYEIDDLEEFEEEFSARVEELLETEGEYCEDCDEESIPWEALSQGGGSGESQRPGSFWKDLGKGLLYATPAIIGGIAAYKGVKHISNNNADAGYRTDPMLGVMAATGATMGIYGAMNSHGGIGGRGSIWCGGRQASPYMIPGGVHAGGPFGYPNTMGLRYPGMGAAFPGAGGFYGMGAGIGFGGGAPYGMGGVPYGMGGIGFGGGGPYGMGGRFGGMGGIGFGGGAPYGMGGVPYGMGGVPYGMGAGIGFGGGAPYGMGGVPYGMGVGIGFGGGGPYDGMGGYGLGGMGGMGGRFGGMGGRFGGMGGRFGGMGGGGSNAQFMNYLQQQREQQYAKEQQVMGLLYEMEKLKVQINQVYYGSSGVSGRGGSRGPVGGGRSEAVGPR